MSASFTRQDRVLSVRERERLKRDIDNRERALKGHIVVEGVNGTGVEGMSARRQGRWESFIDPNVRENPHILRDQIRRMKGVLDQGSPRDLSRKEKRMLEKQAGEDREYLKKNMVSSKTYYQPSVFYNGENRRPNPAFDKSCKAVFERETGNPEFQKRSQRYLNNMRELDPDNPDAANIEKFRPKK